MRTERLTAGECARHVLDEAEAAVDARGQFVVVLAGGRTPQPVYRELGRLGAKQGVDWNRWTVLLSDERCLPMGHENRNDTMLRDLLPAVNASNRIMHIPVEATPEVAASRYSAMLRRVEHIDLAVLGLGADGHTASLFPGTFQNQGMIGTSKRDEQLCIVVRGAPEPATVRASLSAAVLSRARDVWFLVDGADRRKEWAVAQLMEGGAIPASDIHARARRIIDLREPERGKVGQ